METPERPASSFAPLPKNERSKLRKKIIYNVDDWKEPNSFSPKKAFFFISSSSSEDELTNYAAAPPPSKQRIHTPYPHSDSDNSLPGLVTPKPSPPPDFLLSSFFASRQHPNRGNKHSHLRLAISSATFQ